MRVLAIVHEDDAGPGVFADAARARGDELVPWRIAGGEARPDDLEVFGALVVLGGSMDADQQEAHPWLAEENAVLAAALERRQPVLGICLGAQTLTRAAGGTTSRLATPEIGWYEVRLTSAGRSDPLLGPLGSSFHALQWHSCGFDLPRAAVALGSSDFCPQAYRLGETAWAIQFHAEVTLADFESWIDYHAARPDAGDGPADSGKLRTQTRAEIDGWNALGRGLFGRFLDQAALARATR